MNRGAAWSATLTLAGAFAVGGPWERYRPRLPSRETGSLYGQRRHRPRADLAALSLGNGRATDVAMIAFGDRILYVPTQWIDNDSSFAVATSHRPHGPTMSIAEQSGSLRPERELFGRGYDAWPQCLGAVHRFVSLPAARIASERLTATDTFEGWLLQFRGDEAIKLGIIVEPEVPMARWTAYPARGRALDWLSAPPARRDDDDRRLAL